MRGAFVTLVTNQNYALGALALARSLRQVDAGAPLVVMARHCEDLAGLAELEAEGCIIMEVTPPPLSEEFCKAHSRTAQHLSSPFTKGEKPTFHDPLDNFCKLRLWGLDYDKVVFLDADTIVLRNIDKLLDFPEFCAAPNLYHELADMQRMNSGVFTARPAGATFDRMIEELDQPGRFWRRTDQTFLEHFFPDWGGLTYHYNTLQYVYLRLPELWDWPKIKVLHYQFEKPWQTDHPKFKELKPLIDLWHRVLDGKAIPERLPAPAATFDAKQSE